MMQEDADATVGKDADYHTRQLLNTIADGVYPKKKTVEHFTRADKDCGASVAEGLGL